MADGVPWQGRPAQLSAMQLAFDDAANRLAQRLEAESIAPPSPLRRPSRLMLTGTPAPGRLEAAAADPSLDEARALCGTAWTNRLAALLPDGWSLGPCVGAGDGERLEPPCFDSVEATKLAAIGGTPSHMGRLPSLRSGLRLNFIFQNEDEGRLVLRGHENLVNEFALRPGEHLASMFCGYPPFRRDGMNNSLLFDTTAGRSTPRVTTRRYRSGPERFIKAPPGLAIRNFYGRVKKHQVSSGDPTKSDICFEVCCIGAVFGPATAAVWRPDTPVRFSDAATARARAVLALADGDGPLGRLPEVLVHLVLAFAINLFPDEPCVVQIYPAELHGQILDELEDRIANAS